MNIRVHVHKQTQNESDDPNLRYSMVSIASLQDTSDEISITNGLPFQIGPAPFEEASEETEDRIDYVVFSGCGCEIGCPVSDTDPNPNVGAITGTSSSEITIGEGLGSYKIAVPTRYFAMSMAEYHAFTGDEWLTFEPVSGYTGSHCSFSVCVGRDDRSPRCFSSSPPPAADSAALNVSVSAA